MVGLPRSIIKKYGITKKAWQIFRGGTATRKSRKKSHSIKLNRGYQKMARRKTRRYSRGRNKSMKIMPLIVGGLLYGAARQKISDAIAPITSKIPLGNIADNAGMAVVAYFAAKKGSGIIKSAGLVGLGIEAAMAGQDLIQSGFSLTGNNVGSGTFATLA